MMFDSLAIFVGSGTLLYVWLSAVTAPLVSGVRASLRAVRGVGWARALPAALGLIFSVTIVPAALLFVMGMWRPDGAIAILDGSGVAAGATAGAMLYVVRSMALGMPRLSPRVEVVLASALESWAPDDQLQAFEDRYRQHVIAGARPEPSLGGAGLNPAR